MVITKFKTGENPLQCAFIPGNSASSGGVTLSEFQVFLQMIKSNERCEIIRSGLHKIFYEYYMK